MSEPLVPVMGPYDPPKLVWVRVPAVGRRTEDGWVWGHLFQWRRAAEWGVPSWEAEIATAPELDAPRRWVTASSVRERYPEDP